MNRPPEGEVIIVLGRRGQGKSTWAKRYASGLTRLVVWDPKRSYPVEYPQDLGHWAEEHRNAERYRIGSHRIEDAGTLGDIAFKLQDTSYQGSCLLLEECALLFNPHKELEDWARDHIYTGRERGCTLIAIAQRPRGVHVALRSQSTRVICFHQFETKDLDWLEERYGSEKVEEISTLKKLECLDFTDETCSRYVLPLPTQQPRTSRPDDADDTDPQDPSLDSPQEVA